MDDDTIQLEASQVLHDSYHEWVASEGVPLIDDFAVNLATAEVKPWSRFGVNGSVVNVKGRGPYLDLWLLEIGPGLQTVTQRHLFESVAYVISGTGTAVITANGIDRKFEWGPTSMFAVPLNAQYQFFNTSGRETCRIAMVTCFPVVMNLFHEPDLIFGADMDFPDRNAGFDEKGRFLSVSYGKERGTGPEMWETNFVPDLAKFTRLKENEGRGKGSATLAFLFANATLHAHMSEIPVGRYKKGHRHPAGWHIFPVTGRGYSLLWYEGQTERTRVDWAPGYCYAPPDEMYHQHFNVGSEPARYLAISMGSELFPFDPAVAFFRGLTPEQKVERKVQIEYADEDPTIQQLYVAELAKVGVPFEM